MRKVSVPYLVLRDGRPRWVPGPKLRAAGHRGRDLKRADGNWMSDGEAIEAARKLNKEIAQGVIPVAPPKEERRTMSALFTRLRATPKFQIARRDGETPEQDAHVGVAKLKLGARTLHDYLYQLSLLEQWCGDVLIGDLDADMIEEFYHDQAEGRGLAMANHAFRVLKLALFYAVNRLKWISHNPAVGVRMVGSDGRCVIWERDEIPAILGAADWCGLQSVGDAFVIGLLAGQRKQDILALPEGELANGYYVFHQRKRGAKAYVPITRHLQARVIAMRERKAIAFPKVTHTLEVISSDTGLPYPRNAKAFGEDWRLVRAVASGDAVAITRARKDRGINADLPFAPVASCKTKLFMDTRDTAVTWLCMAGCSIAEIANITGHSLKTVQEILNKHYFTRNAELAKLAGVKLDAYLETANIQWA